MFSILMSAAVAAAPPKPNCESPKFGWEISDCTYQDFKRADVEMNKQWQTVLAFMRKRDAKIDRKAGREPLSVDMLLASQRTWLQFRDQHCRLISLTARGGNSTELNLLNECKAELTKARTKQLKALVD